MIIEFPEENKQFEYYFFLEKIDNYTIPYIGIIRKEPIILTRRYNIDLNYINHICTNCNYRYDTENLIKETKNLILFKIKETLDFTLSNLIKNLHTLNKKYRKKYINIEENNTFKYTLLKDYYIIYSRNKIYLSSEEYIYKKIGIDISNILIKSITSKYYLIEEILKMLENVDSDIYNIILYKNKDEAFIYRNLNFSYFKLYYFSNKKYIINHNKNKYTYLYKINSKDSKLNKEKILSLKDCNNINIYINNKNEYIYSLKNFTYKKIDLFERLEEEIKNYIEEINKKFIERRYCNYDNKYNSFALRCKLREEVNDNINKIQFNIEDYLYKDINKQKNIINNFNKIFKKLYKCNKKENTLILYDKIKVNNFGIFLNTISGEYLLLYKNPKKNIFYSFILGNVYMESGKICWGTNKDNLHIYNILYNIKKDNSIKLIEILNIYLNSVFNISTPFLSKKNKEDFYNTYPKYIKYLDNNLNQNNIELDLLSLKKFSPINILNLKKVDNLDLKGFNLNKVVFKNKEPIKLFYNNINQIKIRTINL